MASLKDSLYYVKHNLRLTTMALSERLARVEVASDLPLPPPRLRYRVHGAVDAQSFLAVGSACARDLAALLKDRGREFASFERVLDFGCGCGRTLRCFKEHPPCQHLCGTDIDAAAINWCRKRLSGLAEWNINSLCPPTSYPNSTFDLIYAISVFTHLDQDAQFAWLAELNRIAKPGAWLILTTHGEHVCGQTLDPETQATLHHKGFLFVVKETGFWKLDGLPDTYQTSYHTKEYVAREWPRYFEILAHVEKGMAANQDAVLLAKPLS
jgi:SAM-dependent methyltransferase